MNNELISVIIPCYNVEQYLDDLFSSLNAQTYKNVEYIFIDDGSKDNTLQKVKSLVNQYKLNAQILSQKNSGPSIARNNGLAHANGSLIYFCDSDDVLEPNALAVLSKVINDNNVDLACCHSVHVPYDYKFKNKIKEVTNYKYKRFTSSSEIVSWLLACRHEIGFAAFNKIYKMSILKKFPNFPNVFNSNCYFGEDLLFNLTYCSKCDSAVFLKHIIYRIRLSKNSLVRQSFTPKKLTAFMVEDYFNSLDQTKFADAIPYLKTYLCFTCLDFLLQISKSDYNDVAVVEQLYKKFKDCLKYCRKGKVNPWYRKYFMWTTVPLAKIAANKKLKK